MAASDAHGDSHAVALALAARHATAAEPDPDATLANYAERSRIGDWSMRAALTRYAQPHAVRAARVLSLVRRLDAALRHAARTLQQHTVLCDRALSLETLSGPPIAPYPDSRVADLARVEHADPAVFGEVLTAYEAATAGPLDDVERASLPLLGVALHLEALAETLAGWAERGPRDPPVDEVDATCAWVAARLDELGVPVEEGPPPGRRGRRDRGV